MIAMLLLSAQVTLGCTPAEVREVIAYNYPRDKPQMFQGRTGLWFPESNYKSPAQLRAEADRLEEEEKKAAEARKERERIEALALKCMGWKPCVAWVGPEGKCVTEDDPEGKIIFGTDSALVKVPRTPGGER